MRVAYGPALGLPERGPGQGFVVDEQEYYSAASMLADGRGFSFYDTFTWTRAPLYVIFLAAIFLMAGKNLALIFALQAAMSVLTLLLLALLAGHIAGRTGILSPHIAALSCVAIGSVWLSFTLFSELLLSETLFLLIFVVALLLLERYFQQPAGSRLALLTIFGVGLALGLAALTRSTALGFLPVALIVVLWHGWRLARAGRLVDQVARGLSLAVVLPVLSLLLGALLIVAPWTIRNYVAYGSLVLIDTTAGYNLWLASTGVRDEARLANELKAIDDPVAKQDFAMRQAIGNISADPLAFVVKGFNEVADLWTINPTADERRVGGWSQGRVPALHLFPLFVFEDLLYVAILALAVAGLLASPSDPMKALAVGWVLLWVAMAFVFFAVNRFRFPMVACLLPWVPVGAAYMHQSLRRMLAQRSTNLPLLTRAALIPALVAVPLLLNLPIGFVDLGVSRWNSQAPFRAAELDLAAGRYMEAGELYKQANGELNDTKYGLAATDLALAMQNSDSAAIATVAALPELAPDLSAPGTARFEPYLLRGVAEMLRPNEAAARTYFGARPVDDQTLPALSWFAAHLRLRPISNIDIGSDLDVPFITGFYAAEGYDAGNYRWTSSDVFIRIYNQTDRVVFRWSGWRPASVAPARIQVDWLGCPPMRTDVQPQCTWQSGQPKTLNSADNWTEDEFAVPGALELRLRVNGFVPGGFDPRELGVRVDTVTAR